MHKPGKPIHHQAPIVGAAPGSKATSSVCPHDTRSGSPRPMNASADSARIASAIDRIVLAKITGNRFGSTCFTISWKSPAPSPRRPFDEPALAHRQRLAPHDPRAVPAHDVMPITSTMLMNEEPRIDGEHEGEGQGTAGPGTTRRSASGRRPTGHHGSRRRCRRSEPITIDTTAASSPIISDGLEPQTTSASTERPESSVPIGYSHDGGARIGPSTFVTSSSDASHQHGREDRHQHEHDQDREPGQPHPAPTVRRPRTA